MANNNEFPLQNIRQQFPALNRTYKGKPVIYFDGPGGSQVVRSSIDSIAQYMINGGANLHGQSVTSKETETVIAEAKQAIADLFGASRRGSFWSKNDNFDVCVFKGFKSKLEKGRRDSGYGD